MHELAWTESQNIRKKGEKGKNHEVECHVDDLKSTWNEITIIKTPKKKNS